MYSLSWLAMATTEIITSSMILIHNDYVLRYIFKKLKRIWWLTLTTRATVLRLTSMASSGELSKPHPNIYRSIDLLKSGEATQGQICACRQRHPQFKAASLKQTPWLGPVFKWYGTCALMVDYDYGTLDYNMPTVLFILIILIHWMHS